MIEKTSALFHQLKETEQNRTNINYAAARPPERIVFGFGV